MSVHLRTILLTILSFTIIGFTSSLSSAPILSDAQEKTNGLPNPSARLLPDLNEFDVFAHLLVWTAREAGTDCWAEVLNSNSLTSSNDIHEVHFGWDPGFRVGVGYGLKHDQWDTQAYYTWFKTNGTDHISGEPGSVHSAFLGNFYVDNPQGKGLSGPAYQKAGILWKIRFNLFDWEMGRHFLISKTLALRPFLGAKGGWIHQTIHSKWENPNLSSPQYYYLGTENLKNNFWGIGPEAGINTKWMIFFSKNQFINLFGDFSGATMWGHWSFADVFNNDLQQKIVTKLQNMSSGASMLRAFMGLGWDAHFNQNQCLISAKLGYEMQFWLDQLQFYSFTGGRLDNELTLQGGTFEICFDF